MTSTTEGSAMNLGQCLACRGVDLHQVTMSGMGPVGLKGGAFEGTGPVKCSVCLSCGFIAPYVDGLTLRTVGRVRK
jgi:hypothetical protein